MGWRKRPMVFDNVCQHLNPSCPSSGRPGAIAAKVCKTGKPADHLPSHWRAQRRKGSSIGLFDEKQC